MQITYDTKADAMYLKFHDGEFYKNKEIEVGIIVKNGVCPYYWRLVYE